MSYASVPEERIPNPVTRAAPSPVANLVVVGGPNAGLRVPLAPGEHRVGSHRYSSIVLQDPALARVHLLLTVLPDGGTMVTDTGSGRGTWIAGRPLLRPAALAAGDLLAAGQSLITLTPRGAALPGPPAMPSPCTLAVPPETRPAGVPLTAGVTGALALAGAAGLAVTGWLPGCLLLGGLAPVAGGLAWRWADRDRRRARMDFRRRLVAAERDLAALRAGYAHRLRAALPDAPTVLAAIDGPGLPRRARASPDWLRLRLGWADGAYDPPVSLEEGGDRRMRGEAEQLIARHRSVPAIPVEASLGDLGSIGLAGEPEHVAAAARWIVIQLAALHDPSDLALTVIPRPHESDAWEWVARLPHARSEVAPPRAGGPEVVTVIHEEAAPGRQAVHEMMAGGVHVVLLGEAGGLPALCKALVSLPADGARPALAVPGQGTTDTLGGVDGLALALAERAAGRLGGHQTVPPLAPPPAASLAALLGLDEDVERRVLEHWIRDRAGVAGDGLTAIVGTGPFELSLGGERRHLVIGGDPAARGALLRALAVSIAARYSPRSVALLMAGPALEACAGLPHALPAEALTATLRAELKARSGRRLVIVLDDVESLLRTAPDLALLLDRARRQTRVHLVLATDELGASADRVRLTVAPPPAPATVRAGGPATEFQPAREGDLPALVTAIARVHSMLHIS